MIPEKIGFIGLGHIGGSVAKTVHRIYPDIQIVAYDTCRATLDTALQEGVISEALDQVGKGFSDCNYIYLCAPVLDNADYVRELSGILHDDMLLTDVGSQDRHPRTDSEISGSGTTFYRRSSYVRNGACRL